MYGVAPFPPSPRYAKRWKLYLVGSISINLGLVLGLVLFGGYFLITLGDDIRQYFRATKSKNWSSVTGEITNSGAIREKKGLGVVANYSYIVDGSEHTGTRLLFSARRPIVATEVEVDQLLAPFGRLNEESEFDSIFDKIRMRPDRRVTVYYDPADPHNSTLRQEYFANPELPGLWPVPLMSAFVIAVLIWSIRSWRRYIADKEYEAAGQSRFPA
jgi:hypothetical protein